MFWKKNKPIETPQQPLTLYSIEMAKANLHANRQKLKDHCMRLLVETFNKTVHHATHAGLPYAYFELENIDREANDKFMEMLRDAGYTPNCFVVRTNVVSDYYKYTVWVDKPATPDN